MDESLLQKAREIGEHIRDDETFYFAVVGDVHGAHHHLVQRLNRWEITFDLHLSFILQVGDFESLRSEEDLATMAVPNKYKKMGDFPDYAGRRAQFPWPIFFIGGNHEPYGLLDTMPFGGEVCPNCYYLGRVSALSISRVRILGLTGIYRMEAYNAPRPPVHLIQYRSKRDYIGFTAEDLIAAHALGSAPSQERDPEAPPLVDILLLHEWPGGLADSPEACEALKTCIADDVDDSHAARPLGSEPAAQLVQNLCPRLVCCGHMHFRFGTWVGPGPTPTPLPPPTTTRACIPPPKHSIPRLPTPSMAPRGPRPPVVIPPRGLPISRAPRAKSYAAMPGPVRVECLAKIVDGTNGILILKCLPDGTLESCPCT